MADLNRASALGKEFRDFLLKSNMLAMALGVVIGGVTTALVKSIVDALVMPFVNVITPKGVSWQTWAVGLGDVRFGLGIVLSAVLNFVIVASVVFVLTKLLIRQAAPPPPAPTKTCPACLEAIHPDATRCRFCTSEQPKAA